MAVRTFKLKNMSEQKGISLINKLICDAISENVEVDSPPGGGGWLDSGSFLNAAANIEILVKEEVKSKSIDFLEWATGRNLEISLGVFVDNEGTYGSIEEYYELYLQIKSLAV